MDTIPRDVTECAAVMPRVFIADSVATLAPQQAGPFNAQPEQSSPDSETRTEAVEALVTTLAHDLNNHFTSLTVLLKCLLRRATQDQRADDVQDSERAVQVANRLCAIVTDVLDTARLREGTMAFSQAPVDLTALVVMCGRLFETGDHTIELAIPTAEPVLVIGDARRLGQAIENLLANAVKHSPAGAPIELRLEMVEQPADNLGRAACLSVTDHGRGIAPQLLPHVFDRFVAGPDSTGLGLGLFLARGIARAHAGDLTVHSVPGEGARFSLVLPLRQPL